MDGIGVGKSGLMNGCLGPIVFEKSYEKGGHFAGWDRPGDLAEGLCEMFGKGGGAYGGVKGRDGY
jgi:hypothetical protein